MLKKTTHAPGSNLLKPLEQGVHLPQLNVVELWIGVDVRVGHTDKGASATSLGGTRLDGL